jgi:hypothetical protein
MSCVLRIETGVYMRGITAERKTKLPVLWVQSQAFISPVLCTELQASIRPLL